jgi:hypothetical protein
MNTDEIDLLDKKPKICISANWVYQDQSLSAFICG